MSEDDWRRWVPEAAQRYLPRPDADWMQFVPSEWRRWLDASPAPRPQTRSLRFLAVDEERPGPRWSALYGETGQAYRDWWLGGKGSRPDRATAQARLGGICPSWLMFTASLSGWPAMTTPRRRC